MADNVQWIRLKVGMFDGNSFKKIKRAKIGGVSYRDKLTAVWFELLDLAGKSNANGYLVDNNEIPYQSYEDIAVMLDREEKEIELCMGFFIQERMVEIVDDVYCLTNFMQYQNQDGLEKIREQNRIRQAEYRKRQRNLLPQGDSNVTCNVTSRSFSYSNSYSLSNSINTNINNNIVSIEDINTWFDKVYSIYPRKVSKIQAKNTFTKKLQGMEREEAHRQAVAIYQLLERQNEAWKSENDGDGRKLEYIPYFSTWLNQNAPDSPHGKGKKK